MRKTDDRFRKTAERSERSPARSRDLHRGAAARAGRGGKRQDPRADEQDRLADRRAERQTVARAGGDFYQQGGAGNERTRRETAGRFAERRADLHVSLVRVEPAFPQPRAAARPRIQSQLRDLRPIRFPDGHQTRHAGTEHRHGEIRAFVGAEQDLGDQIRRRPRFGAVHRLRQLHGRRVRKIRADAQGAGSVRFRRPDRGACGTAQNRARAAGARAGAPAVGARRRISGRQRLAVSADEAARRRLAQPDGRGRPRPVHLRLARRQLRHDHELRARFPQRQGDAAGAELPLHRHDPRRLEPADPAQQEPPREKPAHGPGRRAKSQRLVSARRKGGGRSAGARDRQPHRGVSLRRHRRPLPHERPQPRRP